MNKTHKYSLLLLVVWTVLLAAWFAWYENAEHHKIRQGGHVQILTRLSEANIEIEVSDEGGGIAAENIQTIFEPLFTTKAKGVGLGLSIVKTFIENHGGSIKVMSAVGKRTAFTFQLPIHPEAPS
jgi:signal transduction histidine kinase